MSVCGARIEKRFQSHQSSSKSKNDSGKIFQSSSLKKCYQAENIVEKGMRFLLNAKSF